MAVVLRSNASYIGNISDLPPMNAPMPADAAFYANPLTGQFITTSERGVDPAIVFDLSLTRERYVRNAAGGYSLAPAGAAAGRTAYGADGARLGLLVEGSQAQLIAAAQRQDLTQGITSGLSVTAGTADQAWDRWFTLTPAGDAAHDLALASAAAVTGGHHRTFAIEVKAGGHRYVQLSSGASGDADDFANFDLRTQTVVASGAGVTFAGVVPTIQGCICWVQYVSAAAVVETPTVSVIASSAAGKQAAAAAVALAGLAVRLPKLRSVQPGTNRLPPLSPMPGLTSTVMGDRLFPKAALQSADFTYLIRGRNSPWANSSGPTLIGFSAGGSVATSAMIRMTASGNLALISRMAGSISVVREFTATLPPDADILFAVARKGTTLRIVLGGETFEGDLPQIAGAAPYILSSPIDSEGYDGHLRGLIGWQNAKPLADMQALVAAGF